MKWDGMKWEGKGEGEGMGWKGEREKKRVER